MATATPKDAQELFDELVPAGLERYPDKAKEINAVYFFDITGDDGGQWTVDLTANPPVVVKGKADNAQCSIQVSHDDFKTMLAGDPSVGMQLFFQGKLIVTGDMTLATRLQELIELAARERG
jgi:hypothetical protein